MNDIAHELDATRQELRALERTLHTFELRSNTLENNYAHQQETLDKIEVTLKEIFDHVRTVQTLIAERNGVNMFKSRLNNNVYMWLTFIVLILTNDVLWRMFDHHWH